MEKEKRPIIIQLMEELINAWEQKEQRINSLQESLKTMRELYQEQSASQNL